MIRLVRRRALYYSSIVTALAVLVVLCPLTSAVAGPGAVQGPSALSFLPTVGTHSELTPHPTDASGVYGWKNVTAGEYGGMPARWGEAFAVDSQDNLDLFFGGQGTAGTLHNDSWITDDATIRNVTDGLGTSSPPPLVGATMTFDPAANYFLLFGGARNPGVLSNETWEFSAARVAWVNLTGHVGTPPPAQAFAPMAWDARDGYVLLESTVGPFPVWTFASGLWTHRNLSAPPLRTGAALSADPQVASLILFGGTTGSGSMADTWAFSGGAWQRLSLPHAPPPSSNGSLAFDPISSVLLEFGGSASSDTWGFNGTDWSRLALGGSGGPGARVHAQMLYDSYGPFVTLFGGFPPAGGSPLGDTWAWNPPGPPTDPTTTAATLPAWVPPLAAAAIAVPILLALAFLRPPRRKPADAPAPSRSPSAA
ncbi:MAG: hypothetical protein L3K19_05055 [Thermoplasmata archaeon]|nr:hypothetical protein [Thermoplasmata archaeon]